MDGNNEEETTATKSRKLEKQLKVTDLTGPMNFLKVVLKAGAFLDTILDSVSAGSCPSSIPQLLKMEDWL